MGSAASSSVSKLEDTEDGWSDGVQECASPSKKSRPKSGSSRNGSGKTRVAPDLTSESIGISKIKSNCRCSDKNADILKDQLAQLESEKLDLLDQVSSLEQQLENLHSTHDEDSATDILEELQAKHQHIETLETQLDEEKAASEKLRRRLKKKIRVLNKQLAESKQEHSLRLFEVKEEFSQLREDNCRLQGAASHQIPDDVGGRTDNGPGNSDASDNKTRLILSLSSKVSEQESKIIELENRLKLRDAQIHEMGRLTSPPGVEAKSTGGAMAGETGVEPVPRQARWSTSEHSLWSQEEGEEASVTRAEGDRSEQQADCLKDEASELQAIAAEMKQLRRKQGKAKKDKNSSGKSQAVNSVTGIRHEMSSGRHAPEDNAVVVAREAQRDHMSKSDHEMAASSFDTSDNDRSLVNNLSRTVDPASIRQISAPKRRTPRGDIDYDAKLGGDNHKGSPSLEEEMDSLIHSIDTDLLSEFHNSSNCVQNHTMTITG